ncbi:hypothetical protein ECDEC6E_5323 [Escherichia coli DEC6E]|nr:hypothetical protein ECDEC6E_5323 [Escherichia coli DEC6E]
MDLLLVPQAQQQELWLAVLFMILPQLTPQILQCLHQV